MRPLMIVLIVLALGIAGLTAFLAKRFLAQPPAEAPVVAEIERVLVAARDISTGTVLVEDDLRYEEWPRSLIDKRLIVRSGGEDAKAKVLGSVARRNLLIGEPLTGDAVFRQDEGGQLSALLSPGMRAVSIAVNPTTAVNGFIMPGDRVDVALTQQLKREETIDKAEGFEKRKLEYAATEVIFSDLRVIAIDDTLKSDALVIPKAKTITMEVTPNQAQRLTMAANMKGTLSLILRSRIKAEIGGQDGGYVNSYDVGNAFKDANAEFFDDIEPRRAKPPAALPDLPELPAGGFGNWGGMRQVRINRAGTTTIESFPEE